MSGMPDGGMPALGTDTNHNRPKSLCHASDFSCQIIPLLAGESKRFLNHSHDNSVGSSLKKPVDFFFKGVKINIFSLVKRCLKNGEYPGQLNMRLRQNNGSLL